MLNVVVNDFLLAIRALSRLLSAFSLSLTNLVLHSWTGLHASWWPIMQSLYMCSFSGQNLIHRSSAFLYIGRECIDFIYCQYTPAVWRAISNTPPLWKKIHCLESGWIGKCAPLGNLHSLALKGWKLPQGAYFPIHPSSRHCIITIFHKRKSRVISSWPVITGQ